MLFIVYELKLYICDIIKRFFYYDFGFFVFCVIGWKLRVVLVGDKIFYYLLFKLNCWKFVFVGE